MDNMQKMNQKLSDEIQEQRDKIKLLENTDLKKVKLDDENKIAAASKKKMTMMEKVALM